MFTRLVVGTASLLALLVASATPAAAFVLNPDDPAGPNFTAGSDWICDFPTGDSPDWRPWVHVTSDGVDGVSTVEYFARPDSRSSFAMPVGTGKIQAVSYTEWFDDELMLTLERSRVPAEERRACDHPYPSGPVTIRAEVRYVVPPTKPTWTEIETFCEEHGDDPANTQYGTGDDCVRAFVNHIRPNVK